MRRLFVYRTPRMNGRSSGPKKRSGRAVLPLLLRLREICGLTTRDSHIHTASASRRLEKWKTKNMFPHFPTAARDDGSWHSLLLNSASLRSQNPPLHSGGGPFLVRPKVGQSAWPNAPFPRLQPGAFVFLRKDLATDASLTCPSLARPIWPPSGYAGQVRFAFSGPESALPQNKPRRPIHKNPISKLLVHRFRLDSHS